MQLEVAISLIDQTVNSSVPQQVWADLGSGDGLFTKALASLLPRESTIIAVDLNASALHTIALGKESINLQTRVADITTLPDSLPLFDGILMANSLHYVADQNQFLSQLKDHHLKRTGVIVIVEYDLEKSNPWVPYPVNKNTLIAIANASGFQPKIFQKTVKSRYNSSEIYAALLTPYR